MISFYQGRLYLADSEYTILSEVGKDAMKMINCLQGQKKRIVKEMKEKKIDFRSEKMRAYVVHQARFPDIGFGYTAPWSLPDKFFIGEDDNQGLIWFIH